MLIQESLSGSGGLASSFNQADRSSTADVANEHALTQPGSQGRHQVGGLAPFFDEAARAVQLM